MSRRITGIHPRTLADGRKVFDVRTEGRRRADGSRQRIKRRGFGTYDEAKQYLAKMLVDIRRGDFVEPSRQTVATYLERWMEGQRTRLKPSTHAMYAAKIRQHVLGRLGGIRLQALTASHLNAFYGALVSEGRLRGEGGLSPSTVLFLHRILNTALAHAVRQGLLVKNPAEYADPPRKPHREMRTWTGPQVAAFLDHVHQDRLYAAWWLLATTGMRRGECLGLSWDSVDLDNDRLSVVRSLVLVGHSLEFSTPKTARGRRRISLDPGTVRVLREHKRRQAEERLAWGPAYQDQALVFCREDGSPLNPDTFSKNFERHIERAGLPPIRLHDLRHTFASLALSGGVHPKVVQEMLGHASVAMTLDVYSHVLGGLQEDAAERVAAIIFGR